jgi:hypothetical protein
MDCQSIFRGTGFREEELHGFVAARFRDDTGEIRLNGELPMSPIRDDQQLNDSWSAEVDDGVERCTNRSASVKDIIDEDDSRASDSKGKIGLADHWAGESFKGVVAIERDVDHAERDVGTSIDVETFLQPFCDGDTPGMDAHQCNVLKGGVRLTDLFCETIQDA